MEEQKQVIAALQEEDFLTSFSFLFFSLPGAGEGHDRRGLECIAGRLLRAKVTRVIVVIVVGGLSASQIATLNDDSNTED